MDKKVFFNIIVAAIALSVGFQGCKKDPEPELDASPKALDFVYSGEPKTINVTSNVEWIISGKPDWITVSDASGKGDKQITVTAQPNTATSERTATLNITVKGLPAVPVQVRQDGAPPVITQHPQNQTITAGGNVTFSVTATGATSYQWQNSSNGGTTWNNIANTISSLTLTSLSTVVSGWMYRCIVSNDAGSVTSNAATLTVVTAGGTAPTITTTTLPNGTVGAAYSQQLAATGTTPITWTDDYLEDPDYYTSLQSLGLSLSSGGAITGTPNKAGNFFIAVKAQNSAGIDYAQYTLTIAGGGTAPTITSASPLPGATVGLPYTFTFAATGTTPITWAFGGSLPPGLSLNTTTGVLSGTPTTANTYSFWILASNNPGDAEKQFSLTIAAGGTAPAITTQPVNQTVGANSTAVFTVAASGSPAPTYQWQSSTDGSNWSNITNDSYFSGATTATLNITSVPLFWSGSRFRCVATNSAGSATSNVATLTVIPVGTPPVITTTTLPPASVGLSYTVTFAASGTTPLTWDIPYDPPPGLSLSATGVLSGTPTVAGMHKFLIFVINAAGESPTIEFTLYVGDGSATYPFIVNNTAAFQRVGTGTFGWTLDKHYLQTGNINMTGMQWSQIGSSATGNHFTGTYNGDGYSIVNLSSFEGTGDPNKPQVLFGCIGTTGAVRNVALIGADIGGGENTGGIAGINRGTIENCYVTGRDFGDGFVSGVFGTGNVGGIAGINEGVVKNCYTTCNVTGSHPQVGGIVGYNNGGTVMYCYATGNVSGQRIVGGIVGWNEGNVAFNVAMNKEIKVASGNSNSIGRVIGAEASSGSTMMSYNYARTAGLTMYDGIATVTPTSANNGRHGASVAQEQTHGGLAHSWWETTVTFAATDWAFRASNLPILRKKTNGVSGWFDQTQDPKVP